MSYNTNFRNILASIEMFIAWCLWMGLGVLSSYIPGWKGGYTIWRCLQLQKILADVPYAKIMSMAAGKKSADFADSRVVITAEEITFYAFMMNPKIRHGLRALILCLALCIAIFAGADWIIIYLAVAILFLFGIARLAQGSMDIF